LSRVASSPSPPKISFAQSPTTTDSSQGFCATAPLASARTSSGMLLLSALISSIAAPHLTRRDKLDRP
jgi:hypothetical protein